ncbi:hypothetical protein [Glutamicibacter sp.]|jgi:hypothetical protein|nr:hypothetical protein [Glutamicibacter sp.]HJX79173.1 hypothetical protein [Glutamicibacter sp.]
MIEYEMEPDEWLEERKAKLERELDMIDNLLRQLREARRKRAKEQGLIK